MEIIFCTDLFNALNPKDFPTYISCVAGILLAIPLYFRSSRIDSDIGVISVYLNHIDAENAGILFGKKPRGYLRVQISIFSIMLALFSISFFIVIYFLGNVHSINYYMTNYAPTQATFELVFILSIWRRAEFLWISAIGRSLKYEKFLSVSDAFLGFLFHMGIILLVAAMWLTYKPLSCS